LVRQHQLGISCPNTIADIKQLIRQLVNGQLELKSPPPECTDHFDYRTLTGDLAKALNDAWAEHSLEHPSNTARQWGWQLGLRVVQLKADSEVATWDRYVLDRPSASGYHLAAWRQVLEEVFGHRTIYLMVKDNRGDVHGVLPLVLLSSRLFGR